MTLMPAVSARTPPERANCGQHDLPAWSAASCGRVQHLRVCRGGGGALRAGDTGRLGRRVLRPGNAVAPTN